VRNVRTRAGTALALHRLMTARIALAWFVGSLIASPARAAETPPALPPIPGPSATGGEKPLEPAPAPPCAEPDADGPFWSSTGCLGVFGLRGSAVNTQGAPAADGSGLMIQGEGAEFARRGIFSSKGSHRLAIGGGGAGFEGTLQGGLAGGFRIPFGEKHGPVLRAGAFGYLRGNDAFYASQLELPQVQLGYQYLRGATVIELGVTSGAVLTGRFRAGETETRRLGAGLEVGAYAALHVPYFRLALSGMRLPASDALSSPVRTAEGTLCGLAAPIAICFDGRAATADAFVWPGTSASEVRSLYAGLTAGFTRE
jgi:hypothetical protein